MSFLNPGPADHAIERYRQARKRLLRWKTMLAIWMAAAGLTVATAAWAAIMDAPIGVVIVLILLLAVDGFALVFVSGCVDRAGRSMRADQSNLRGYGLNPEDYCD